MPGEQETPPELPHREDSSQRFEGPPGEAEPLIGEHVTPPEPPQHEDSSQRFERPPGEAEPLLGEHVTPPEPPQHEDSSQRFERPPGEAEPPIGEHVTPSEPPHGEVSGQPPDPPPGAPREPAVQDWPSPADPAPHSREASPEAQAPVEAEQAATGPPPEVPPAAPEQPPSQVERPHGEQETPPGEDSSPRFELPPSEDARPPEPQTDLETGSSPEVERARIENKSLAQPSQGTAESEGFESATPSRTDASLPDDANPPEPPPNKLPYRSEGAAYEATQEPTPDESTAGNGPQDAESSPGQSPDELERKPWSQPEQARLEEPEVPWSREPPDRPDLLETQKPPLLEPLPPPQPLEPLTPSEGEAPDLREPPRAKLVEPPLPAEPSPPEETDPLTPHERVEGLAVSQPQAPLEANGTREPPDRAALENAEQRTDSGELQESGRALESEPPFEDPEQAADPGESGLELAPPDSPSGTGVPPEFQERALDPGTGEALTTTRRPSKRAVETFGEASEERSGTFARAGTSYGELNEAEITRGLRVDYDARAGRPRVIEYRVDAENVDLPALTERSFTRDVSTRGAQSSDAAYVNSGYDRGHLAQREAFKGAVDVEAAADHFTNVVPMTPELNRGAGSPWRAAESRTIALARLHGSVTVEVVPIYDEFPPRLRDGTPVPDAISRKVVGPGGEIIDSQTFPNRVASPPVQEPPRPEPSRSAAEAVAVSRPPRPEPRTFERVYVERPEHFLAFTEPDPAAVTSGSNIHTVDQQFRPVKAEGWLWLSPAVRARAMQTFVASPYPGTNGAHLIAARFHGTGDASNLVPFPENVNLSAMKVFENMLGDRLAKGEQLYLQAFVRYSDTGYIPTEIAYRVFQVKGDALVKTDDRRCDVTGGTWAH